MKGDSSMAYYDVCPDCGAHLDPGEKCDCQEQGKGHAEYFNQFLEEPHGGGQIAFRWCMGSHKEGGKEGHA